MPSLSQSQRTLSCPTGSSASVQSPASKWNGAPRSAVLGSTVKSATGGVFPEPSGMTVTRTEVVEVRLPVSFTCRATSLTPWVA